uniref:Putative lipocalin n=2 Tax=Rhipicephalus microplus TaxID=6941 RepID=A0A6G5A2Y1_RHIMP
MVAMQIIMMILIALSISGPALSLWRDVVDISLFYSNRSVICTLKTTMDVTARYSKIDYVNNTTPDYTDFRRYYGEDHDPPYEDLLGTFMNMDKTRKDPPYNGMLVTLQQGGTNKSIEELSKSFGNNTCGIFFVYPWTEQGMYMELRVKTSMVGSVDKDCMSEYLKVTLNSTVTTLNNKTCLQARQG